jgi:hypothetical protein
MGRGRRGLLHKMLYGVKEEDEGKGNGVVGK